MNVINVNDIVLGRLIGSGTSGIVTKCTFNDNQYCMKAIMNTYPKSIVANIKQMTEIDFDKEYFVPLYVVENNAGDFLGYLMHYDENLMLSSKITNIYDKLIFLKESKKVIEKLHKKYKIIHGDLVASNMLCDKNNNSFLIDFDSSLRFGQSYDYKEAFRLFVQRYLKYYPINKKIDSFTFNVATLKMLGNYPTVNMMFKDISLGEYKMFQEDKNVKRLTKELLLSDTRKEYSGEYIIDYIMEV